MSRVMVGKQVEVVAAEESKKEGRRPGSLPDDLKPEIKDAVAGIFSDVGTKVYDEAKGLLVDEVGRIIDSALRDLYDQVSKRAGTIGVDSALPHLGVWLSRLVQDIRDFGIDEVNNQLQGKVSAYSADFASGVIGEEPASPEESMLGVEVPDVEEVGGLGDLVSDEAPGAVPEAAELGDLLKGPAPGAPVPPETEVGTPAGAVPGPLPAAAKTLGDLRRKLMPQPARRSVVAGSKEHAELLRSAEEKLMQLEK